MNFAHEFIRRAQIPRRRHKFVVGHILDAAHFAKHLAGVPNRLYDVAGAGLALGADHSGAFADAAERLAQVAAAAHKRHFEIVLVDVIVLVGGRQHFGFVDVVHAQRFQYLRLDEMADARFRHHRNGNAVYDVLDHRRIGHARHAARLANIGRHAL